MKRQTSAGISKVRQYKEAYLLMLPFLVVFFVFTIWPVLLSVLLSFTSYNVLEMPKFIGWQNYVRLFVQDEIFSIAVKNTLLFALITGPVSYILCLLFAWIINELPRRTRTLMTLVFYAPSISGSIYTIWLLVFDGDMYGYLNSFLMKAGFISDPIQWLKDPKYMMAVVILVQLWVSLGTSFLTMCAGFTTIDRQYYEAGAIDGVKNRWQELWFITLPMMAPHLMLAAVLAITASFGAEQVATAMTGFPSTDYATHTVMHHMRDYGSIRYERGYASAIASLLFLTSIGINRIVQRFLRKVGQ
ncbi:MAG: carbohydrate ABC transporter permease [Saccharofermentanales bacterium]